MKRAPQRVRLAKGVALRAVLPAGLALASAPIGRDLDEHALQTQMARWLELVIDPAHVWWTSIDHANARSAATGALRKARGVKAGIPDVLLVYRPTGGGRDAGGLCGLVELKVGDNRLSDEQKQVHDAVRTVGGWVETCYSLEEVDAALTRRGVPHKAVAWSLSPRRGPVAGETRPSRGGGPRDGVGIAAGGPSPALPIGSAPATVNHENAISGST